MTKTFEGKRALVLGGSRGIGAAIVRRLVEDGAQVLFTYSGSKELAETLASETGAETARLDNADRAALTDFIAARGPFAIAVVSAGLYVGGDPLTLDPDEVDRLIDVNVRAPYFAAVEAARDMPEGGRVVIIGSNTADRMPFPGNTAYAMSKSAMQGLARGLARDFGARRITVNVVQPGPTDTDMNPADGPNRDKMHSVMAIKRHATGAEVAAMVAYLAGPEAGIVTGSMQTIDGGFTA